MPWQRIMLQNLLHPKRQGGKATAHVRISAPSWRAPLIPNIPVSWPSNYDRQASRF